MEGAKGFNKRASVTSSTKENGSKMARQKGGPPEGTGDDLGQNGIDNSLSSLNMDLVGAMGEMTLGGGGSAVSPRSHSDQFRADEDATTSDESVDEEEDAVEESVEASEGEKQQVRALRKNQMDIMKIDEWFYNEMHKLEIESSKRMAPLWNRRFELVTGKARPTEEEAVFHLEKETIEEVDKKDKVNGIKKSVAVDSPVAIPQFWMSIFRSCDTLALWTEPTDFVVLKHLIDVRVEVTENPMAFTLFFHFEPNEHFTNTVLTKVYLMKNEVDPETPFIFDGTEIIKAEGCKIHWNDGKDVTKKLITKRQKHKQSGHVRNIEQIVDVPSFFDFFNPPDLSLVTSDDEREEVDEKLTADYELGQFIREKLIPRATLYFTGEAQLLEKMFDSSSEDETDEEEEEDSEDEESDVARAHNGGREVEC